MQILLLIIAALMATEMTRAEETVIVKNVLGAEGPLYFDGNLYFVGWVSNSLSKWDGKKTTLLNLLTKNKVDSWWIGPDSMKVDAKGNIYVAQWSGGKVLKISPAGKLLHVFNIAAGDGTTNVAFGEGEKDLYITVVKDPNDPKAAGCIVKIPNVQ